MDIGIEMDNGKPHASHFLPVIRSADSEAIAMLITD
jgi:hypothetical protein